MENKERLKDLVEELENIYGDITLSKDFFEIIVQETDPKPTPAQTESTYQRLRVMNAVYWQRVIDEEKALQNVFEKLHKATA